MLFNTPQYIFFLPTVVLAYYILPKKIRYIWLLIVSYYFYMQWNPLYITLLFSCTLLTYISGRVIAKLEASKTDGEESDTEKIKRKQKICLAVCVGLNLCVLGFFKYFDFGLAYLNYLLRLIHVNEVGWNHNIILPIGISFYTLQALGYLIDVYRGEIPVEKNFLRYALFISFFPQLVAGPIERSGNLLVQLRTPHSFRYENLRRGLLLILYGMFLKVVIADRAAVIVNTVYENSSLYPGFYVVVATFFFSIRIYCDFYGYSTIARGSALLMGIKLMDNFNAPYYSKSVKEFWRRWHISLSGWFRDYLYIPLGGNRKGKVRKECNLLIVFAISGFWHGASMSYIFWGFLNGIYQVLSDAAVKLKRFGVNRFSRRLFQTIVTFLLIMFTWIFFCAGSMKTAYEVIANMFRVNNWTILFDGSLYELGVAKNCMNALLASILALFAVDYYKYQGKDVAGLLLKQGWFFRVLIIMLLLFAILLYGCYGEVYDARQFIYFQF